MTNIAFEHHHFFMGKVTISMASFLYVYQRLYIYVCVCVCVFHFSSMIL